MAKALRLLKLANYENLVELRLDNCQVTGAIMVQIRDFIKQQAQVLSEKSTLQVLSMSNCGLSFFTASNSDIYSSNMNIGRSKTNTFKNEEEMLLEILEMVKTSLKHLNLSENDLRSKTDLGHHHFKFIDSVRKIYLAKTKAKVAYPLMMLDLRGTCLIQDETNPEQELKNLSYL